MLNTVSNLISEKYIFPTPSVQKYKNIHFWNWCDLNVYKIVKTIADIALIKDTVFKWTVRFLAIV